MFLQPLRKRRRIKDTIPTLRDDIRSLESYLTEWRHIPYLKVPPRTTAISRMGKGDLFSAREELHRTKNRVHAHRVLPCNLARLPTAVLRYVFSFLCPPLGHSNLHKLFPLCTLMRTAPEWKSPVMKFWNAENAPVAQHIKILQGLGHFPSVKTSALKTVEPVEAVKLLEHLQEEQLMRYKVWKLHKVLEDRLERFKRRETNLALNVEIGHVKALGMINPDDLCREDFVHTSPLVNRFTRPSTCWQRKRLLHAELASCGLEERMNVPMTTSFVNGTLIEPVLFVVAMTEIKIMLNTTGSKPARALLKETEIRFKQTLLGRMPQTRKDWQDIVEEHKNETELRGSIQDGVLCTAVKCRKI
jgi:hypothetical protein